MDNQVFEKNLEKIGAALRNLKPGADCPPDDLLFDYVYGELSEAERKQVLEHSRSCLRCRFELMRLETERAARSDAYTQAPEATIAGALGTKRLERAREILAARSTAGPPKPAASLTLILDKYRARLEAGWEKFQAAIETMQEWILGAGVPLVVERGVSLDAHSPLEFTYYVGDRPLELPATPPTESNYYTLVMARPEKGDVVVLRSNWKISSPLHIDPELSEDDLGCNPLYLIYTSGTLDIGEDEIDITPDRFMKIVSQARNENARIATLMLKVTRKA